jgi:transcriptional regulator with XRE-family HTH domain|tara:strand:- start:512 stop:877 length:366 start_codon:yes stop_codon:yes gene_type:complete
MASIPERQQQFNRQKVARLLRESRLRARLSLRELAVRADTSHSTIAAYERGSKAPGADVFLRLLNACGTDIGLASSPRLHFPGRKDERGRELQEVLNLAEQFPARHATDLQYPRLPHGQSR